MSLAGKLEDVPLADVMQFIHLGRRTGAEDLPQALLPTRLRVRSQLDATAHRNFLEALGEELDHHRPGFLRALGADADRHSAEQRVAQRNAARIFSKNPSSGL